MNYKVNLIISESSVKGLIARKNRVDVVRGDHAYIVYCEDGRIGYKLDYVINEAYLRKANKQYHKYFYKIESDVNARLKYGDSTVRDIVCNSIIDTVQAELDLFMPNYWRR